MKSFILMLILFFTVNSVSSQNQPYISTEKAIADIEYMIHTIEEVHYNPYFSIKNAQFKKNKETLLSEFEPDSILLKKFVATGMKLAAQLSGGHTAMDWKNPSIIPEIKASQYIPFTGQLTDNNQQFIVIRSASSEILKGAVIESINGVSMVEIYKECMSYIGGIESFKNSTCERLLPIYLFYTEKISTPFSIKISGVDGTFNTPGIDFEGLQEFLNGKQRKENYTFQIIKKDVGLISYNSCQDYSGFKKFLKQTFKEIEDKNITKLIIDIRENGGGDSGLNDLLLAYITETSYRQSSGRFWKVSEEAKAAYQANPLYEKNLGQDFMKEYVESENQSIIENVQEELIKPQKPKNYFNQKTCFLIGPNTFSSANFLADAVKTYNLSTLIGLATGEYTNDFGELLEFTLPNSGNSIFVSSAYDIGANGNPNLFEPVYPDIQTTEDALLYALDWIK
jgi:hypothetical protein